MGLNREERREKREKRREKREEKREKRTEGLNQWREKFRGGIKYIFCF